MREPCATCGKPATIGNPPACTICYELEVESIGADPEVLRARTLARFQKFTAARMSTESDPVDMHSAGEVKEES